MQNIGDRTKNDHPTTLELSELNAHLTISAEPVTRTDGTTGYEPMNLLVLEQIQRNDRHVQDCNLCQASMAEIAER